MKSYLEIEKQTLHIHDIVDIIEQFYCMELEDLGEKVMHCAKQCDLCKEKEIK